LVEIKVPIEAVGTGGVGSRTLVSVAIKLVAGYGRKRPTISRKPLVAGAGNLIYLPIRRAG